jgi:hypothetical protein
VKLTMSLSPDVEIRCHVAGVERKLHLRSDMGAMFFSLAFLAREFTLEDDIALCTSEGCPVPCVIRDCRPAVRLIPSDSYFVVGTRDALRAPLVRVERQSEPAAAAASDKVDSSASARAHYESSLQDVLHYKVASKYPPAMRSWAAGRKRVEVEAAQRALRSRASRYGLRWNDNREPVLQKEIKHAEQGIVAVDVLIDDLDVRPRARSDTQSTI